jgi:hypothetical protein
MSLSKGHFLISGLFLAVLIIWLCGCGNGSGEKLPLVKAGDAKIVAAYIKRDSGAAVDIVLRRIFKNIKTDSVKGVDNVIYDTLYGTPIYIKLLDSLQRFVKTHDGRDSINPNPQYIGIGKDSVFTDICNTPIDSLIRKDYLLRHRK